MKKHYWIIGFILVFMLTGCDLSLAQDITPPPNIQKAVFTPEPDEQVEELQEVVPEDFGFDILPDADFGLMLFTENCASCHGVDGLVESMVFNGQDTLVAPIGDPEYRAGFTPQEWFMLIAEGNMAEMMPPFKTLLTAEERWGVVGYTFNLNVETDAIANGSELFADKCTSCHGPEGMGDGTRAANLNPGPADFTNQAFMSELSNADLGTLIGSGTASGMPAFSGSLSGEEISNLTVYLRAFAFPYFNEDTIIEVDPGSGEDLPDEEPVDGAAPEFDADGNFLSDITGIVIPSDGIDSVVGLKVNLLGIDSSGAMLSLESVVLDDGTFIFEDIQMGHGWQFLATVTLDGAQFPAEEALNIIEAKEIYEFEVRIFETTNGLDDLVYENVHIFIDYLTVDLFTVVQSYTISNLGTEMVVPVSDMEPVIIYGLPANAGNLGFMDQNAAGFIRGVPGGIGDLNYVPVGDSTYSLIFYYELPVADVINIDIPLLLDLKEALLFLPADGLELKSDQFISQGLETRSPSDQRMMYSAENLSAGDVLTIEIREDTGFLNLGNLSINLDILFGGLGLIAVIAIIGFWFRRSQDTTEPYIAEEDMQEILLDKIVALDERFGKGKISDQDYQKHREALKADLAELLED